MARDFDGSSDGISCDGNASLLDVDNGAAFIWFNWDNAGTNDLMTSCRVDSNNNIALQIITSGNMWAKYKAGGTQSENTVAADVNSWATISLTWDTGADEVKTYHNGSQYGSTLGSLGTWSGTPTILGIGEENALGNFNGKLAYAVWWTSTLSSNEENALNNGVNPFAIRNESQFCLFPVNGNESPEQNYTGNGNNGTVTGTTKFSGNPPVELMENYL